MRGVCDKIWNRERGKGENVMTKRNKKKCMCGMMKIKGNETRQDVKREKWKKNINTK